MLILFAAGGSLALLIAALGFQFIGDMAPCKLCIWQRYPHGVAVLCGVIALALKDRIWCILGACAAAASGFVGAYHTGVERDWWEGPTTCTSGAINDISAKDLMTQILNAPLVRCDDVAWEMFTLSMASWNAIASFALAGLWIIAARR
ncbi:disulfide bond formation protein B [Aliiroseovarius sp. YM-037]|uniref:disulfide bond formation protein B n=1 Tax=Aliiroseovarius sp. YM-037 TaxID=3341728 RepID=UPI003A80FDEA